MVLRFTIRTLTLPVRGGGVESTTKWTRKTGGRGEHPRAIGNGYLYGTTKPPHEWGNTRRPRTGSGKAPPLVHVRDFSQSRSGWIKPCQTVRETDSTCIFPHCGAVGSVTSRSSNSSTRGANESGQPVSTRQNPCRQREQRMNRFRINSWSEGLTAVFPAPCDGAGRGAYRSGCSTVHEPSARRVHGRS